MDAGREKVMFPLPHIEIKDEPGTARGDKMTERDKERETDRDGDKERESNSQ